MIAANPSLPNYLQFILAEDSEPSVKIALAARANLDLDVAAHLAADDNALVKAAVLQNKELEPEIFQMWADLDDETCQMLLLRRSQDLHPTILESNNCVIRPMGPTIFSTIPPSWDRTIASFDLLI